MNPDPMVDRHILGVRIDPITGAELIRVTERSIAGRLGEILLPVNAHFLNLAAEHRWLREFADTAGVHVVAEGKGVMVAGRILGVRIPEQVRFADWVFTLFDLCRRQGYTIFFLGAADGVAERAAERLQRDFPGLKIAGVHAGYFSEGSPAVDDVVQLINARKPDVLLTGMSMPVEEQWVAANRSRLYAGVIVLGAGCFEWLSGNTATAPSWVGGLYLEWFFRLLQEPGRLWRRYILGNPMFAFRVFRQFLEGRTSDR